MKRKGYQMTTQNILIWDYEYMQDEHGQMSG